MIYRSRVHISADELKYIEDAIENGGMGEDETITNTAKFSNGYEMDIKCCGADDEPAWTEAVLFDSEGSQIAVSEPSDDYFGIWELEDNDGNTYKANVVKVIKRSVDEAKNVLESAGYLVERTPLEARTDDRFKVPKLSKVKDKIDDKVRYFKKLCVGNAESYEDWYANKFNEMFGYKPTTIGSSSGQNTYYIKVSFNIEQKIKEERIRDRLFNKLESLQIEKNLSPIKNTQLLVLSVSSDFHSKEIYYSIKLALDKECFDEESTDFEILKTISFYKKELNVIYNNLTEKVNKVISMFERSYNRAWKNESYRLTEGRINLKAFKQAVFDLAVKMGAIYDAAYDAANMIDMDMAKESTVEELAREIAQEYPDKIKPYGKRRF